MLVNLHLALLNLTTWVKKCLLPLGLTTSETRKPLFVETIFWPQSWVRTWVHKEFLGFLASVEEHAGKGGRRKTWKEVSKSSMLRARMWGASTWSAWCALLGQEVSQLGRSRGPLVYVNMPNSVLPHGLCICWSLHLECPSKTLCRAGVSSPRSYFKCHLPRKRFSNPPKHVTTPSLHHPLPSSPASFTSWHFPTPLRILCMDLQCVFPVVMQHSPGGSHISLLAIPST